MGAITSSTTHKSIAIVWVILTRNNGLAIYNISVTVRSDADTCDSRVAALLGAHSDWHRGL